MTRSIAPIYPFFDAASARSLARVSNVDSDALLAAASDDDLELALRLVAWNQRDLGQFLKARTPL
ncbi:MAG TPA: hypothetical protein VH328_09965 [Burkholderiaceae bacterium]|jgi:hypothetical protein|nr:hypothetical protein [Burkholderiaceae bacterium]